MEPNWMYPFAGVMAFVVPILIIWSGVWKAIALWKAARNGQMAWYIVMCIVNTAGILEIIYIFVFSRKNQQVTPVSSV